jgi:hypothetical protein
MFQIGILISTSVFHKTSQIFDENYVLVHSSNVNIKYNERFENLLNINN